MDTILQAISTLTMAHTEGKAIIGFSIVGLALASGLITGGLISRQQKEGAAMQSCSKQRGYHVPGDKDEEDNLRGEVSSVGDIKRMDQIVSLLEWQESTHTFDKPLGHGTTLRTGSCFAFLEEILVTVLVTVRSRIWS